MPLFAQWSRQKKIQKSVNQTANKGTSDHIYRSMTIIFQGKIFQ